MLIIWFLRALKLLKSTEQAISRVSMDQHLWLSFKLWLLSYTRHFIFLFLLTLIAVCIIDVVRDSLPKQNMWLLIVLLGVVQGERWDYADCAQISLQKAIFEVWLVSYLLSWLLFHEWHSLVKRAFDTLAVFFWMHYRCTFRQICFQENSRLYRRDTSLVSCIVVA